MNRLCVHTMTTKPWSLEDCARHYAAAGVKGITVWRQHLGGHSPQDAGAMLRDAGLAIVSLCRGGFFPANTGAGRQAAIDDNLLAIEQAHGLGAPLLVLVCGAVPGQSLAESRKQITDGIAAVLPAAQQAGVTLAIEPLHPMYASDRAVVSTLKQALDLAEPFDADTVGVVVDTFHVWWDPEVFAQIARAGASGRIASYQVCDWQTPLPEDVLLGRHYPGDGVIDFAAFTEAVEAAGYAGDIEVEIFNQAIWDAPWPEVVARTAGSFDAVVAPHLAAVTSPA
jgi:sugar phosphate isomerase/epimerase